MDAAGSGGQRSEGAEALFNALYQEHQKALYGYFFGRTGDWDAALDLLQECFLRVWRNITLLQALTRDGRRFWLFAVARNLATDFYRKRGARNAALEEILSVAAQRDAGASGPDALVEDREQMALLSLAIHRLPEDLRTVLALHVLSERSSREIGEILGKPAGTIRYQLSLARKRLAAELRLAENDTDK